MSTKTVLITGGSRGIGCAVATKFAQNGLNVAVSYQKSKQQAEQLCEDLVQKFGIKAMCFQADMQNLEQLNLLFDSVVQNFGTIDILVNNAGVCLDMPLSNKTVEHFQKTFQTNVFGAFHLTKLVGEHMVQKGGGKIVFVSSNNTFGGHYPTTIDYDASKASINLLTKNFAIEFAPCVNVNAVAPGWIDTDMNKNVLTPDVKELEQNRILKRRIGTPEDVANAIFFLTSSQADYINASVVVVDGGMF